MNYLTHLLLADIDDEAMLGAFLGDFVKGRQLDHFTPVVAREITLHRRIDSFTDAHPIVQSALARFEPERRRFGGIALDVFYDHVLAQNFEQYGPASLNVFSRRAYRVLQQDNAQMPMQARTVADRMIGQDWFAAYADFDGLGMALHGIGRRLSRGSEHLEACARDLAQHYASLAAGFPELLDDLRSFSRTQRAALQLVRSND